MKINSNVHESWDYSIPHIYRRSMDLQDEGWSPYQNDLLSSWYQLYETKKQQYGNGIHLNTCSTLYTSAKKSDCTLHRHMFYKALVKETLSSILSEIISGLPLCFKIKLQLSRQIIHLVSLFTPDKKLSTVLNLIFSRMRSQSTNLMST